MVDADEDVVIEATRTVYEAVADRTSQAERDGRVIAIDLGGQILPRKPLRKPPIQRDLPVLAAPWHARLHGQLENLLRIQVAAPERTSR